MVWQHIPLTSAAVEPGGVAIHRRRLQKQDAEHAGLQPDAQYQLAANDTLQIGYVGNTVHHLAVYVNPNTPREILPLGLDSLAFSPYPDFSGVTYTSFAGNSHYNGLQTNYEHRFNQGLSVLANFTWSNCMTDAVDVLNATSNHRIPRSHSCPDWGINKDFGRCDFDINKVVHVSGIYELPVGRGKTFLARQRPRGECDPRRMGDELDSDSAGRPARHDSVRNEHDFGLRLLCGSKWRDRIPNAGPHNVNQWLNPAAFATPPVATTIGQSDYSPLGGGPGTIRWSRIPPLGLLAVQGVPAYRRGSVWNSVRNSST